MEEQLIEFSTAKLAKEKGFNEPVYYHYSENPVNNLEILYKPDDPRADQCWVLTNYNDNKFLFKKYSVPTQNLLQRWLREVHFIHINVSPTDDNEGNNPVKWTYSYISRYDNAIHDDAFSMITDELFDTYEQALEEGLYEGLQLIN